MATKKLEMRQPAAAVEVTPCLRAVECIRRLRGGSQPYLLRAEDDDHYIVKFRNNPQHVRILANEMLAGRLAALIGLPIPGLAFVEVSQELIQAHPPLEFEVGARREPCAPGLQFGSRFPGKLGKTLVVDFLPDRLLARVDPDIFLGALVFDKWTCNCDGRQFIFYRSAEDEGSAYSAFLIDHGFCFNDGEWDFPDNAIRSIYPRRAVYEKVRGLRSFENFLSKLENLEFSDLQQCAQGIPEGWLGDEPGDFERLLERLYERRRRVRQALIDTKNCALNPFPNWRH